MLLMDAVPCPVLVTDGNGAILSINRSALQVTGGNAEVWAGQTLDSLLPRPSRMFLQTHVWPMLLKHGSVREIQLQMLDAQGQRLPVLVNCERSPEGDGKSWVWVFFIAGERNRFEAALLRARAQADEAAALAAHRERFLRTVTDAVPGQVGYWDRDLRCRFANLGYLEWFGRRHEEVLGAELKDLMCAPTLLFSQPYIDAALQGLPQRFERTQWMADGRQTCALVNYIPDVSEQGAVLGFFSLVIDITSQKEAEGDLRLAASIVENTAEAIMVTDESDHIVSVNPAFTAVTGYPAAEVIGWPASLLDAGRQEEALHAKVSNELALHGRWTGESWARQRDGSVFLVRHAVTAISAAPGMPARRVSVFSDVTERWRSSERMRHLAFHDPLTELPNRMLLLERLGQLIGHTGSEARNAAVIFIDLDRFKVVNDTLGHAVGDGLLKAVAGDLQALVRHSDTVARLGGDEFVILLDHVTGREEIETIARRIVAAVGGRRSIEEHRLDVGASLGIAMFPQDAREREQLIAHADAALYAVKRAGRSGYRFFDELSAVDTGGVLADDSTARLSSLRQAPRS